MILKISTFIVAFLLSLGFFSALLHQAPLVYGATVSTFDSWITTNTAATSTAKGNLQVNKRLWVNGTSTLATTTAYLLDTGGQVFNVKAFGAKGDGVTDDTAVIQLVMTLAGPSGATVYLPPGSYLITSPLKWQPHFHHTQEGLLAPSILGAGTGNTPDKGSATSSPTNLVASSTFPLGEFMIDYIGATSTDQAIVGFIISNFTISCANRCAGVRVVNQLNALWSNLVINYAAKPNPADTTGTPTAAVNFLASPSVNAFNNRIDNVEVYGPAQDGFLLNEGYGSKVFGTKITSINAGRSGITIGDNTTLVGCESQGSGENDFVLRGGELIGCGNLGQIGGAAHNVFRIDVGAQHLISVTGGEFWGNSHAGQTEASSSMIYIVNGVSAIFSNVHFETGTQTSHWVWMQPGVTGKLMFTGSVFGTQNGSLSTAVPFYTQGSDSVIHYVNTPDIGPLKIQDGGTATITQATSGLTYFDGSAIISGNSLTWSPPVAATGTLSANWPLDNSTGTSSADISSGGASPMLMYTTTTATSTDTYKGSGLSWLFNSGTRDAGTVPFTFSQTAYSVSFWFKNTTSGMGADDNWISQAGSISIARQGTNNIQVYAYLDAPGDFATPRRLRFFGPSGVGPTDGAWHKLDMVVYVNGSGNAKMNIYQDGVALQTEQGTDYTGDATTPSGNLYIGNSYSPSTSNVLSDGKMDDIKIYNNVALSATDVLNNYNSDIAYRGLSIQNNLNANGIVTAATFVSTSTTASSTFANGINLTSGCFSKNSVCIGSNSGTVTSVGVSVPSLLSVSGSPVTTSGTIALTYSGTPLPLANGGTATTTYYTGGVIFSDGSLLTQAAASSSFYWDNTNKRLGLGTSTPSSVLNIEGGSTGDQFRLSTAGAGRIYKIGRNTTTGLLEFAGLESGFSGYTFFRNTSTVLLTMLNNGNVGVGVTTPTYFLDTAGTGHFTSYVDATNFIATSTTATSLINSNVDLSWGTTNLSTAGLVVGGKSGTSADLGSLFISTSGSGNYVAGLGINGSGGGAGIPSIMQLRALGTKFAGYSSNMSFSTTNGTTETEAMRITNAQKIGIGTTTPNWPLQIAGTGPSLAISDTGAGAANQKHWLFSSMNGNLYIGTSTDVYATTTPHLTILNSGYTGLATSTPGSPLSINNLANFTLATSTFYSTGGINLTGGGCFAIGGTCIGASGASNLANPFNITTNFGANTQATSAVLWMQAGLQASSTSYFVNLLTTASSSFQNITTQLATMTNATATSFAISSISGSTQCLHVNTNGTISGTGTDCGSGGASNLANPFFVTTNYGASTQATSAVVWFQNGLQASSTSYFVNAVHTSSTTLRDFTGQRSTTTEATTTSLAVTGTAKIGTISALLLGTSGFVSAYGGATCTNQFLTVLSAAGAGTCASVNLANGTQVTGTLPFGNGGTGATTFSRNTIITSNAAGTALISTTSQLTVGNLVASTTATSTFVGSVSIATSTPWAALTLDRNSKLASSTIAVSEYRPAATSTAATLDCRTSIQHKWRIGASATTLTLAGMIPGQTCRVIVENPNSAAGALTWAAPAGWYLSWVGGVVPAQTITANHSDVWSFVATQGSSTPVIIGTASLNAF